MTLKKNTPKILSSIVVDPNTDLGKKVSQSLGTITRSRTRAQVHAALWPNCFVTMKKLSQHLGDVSSAEEDVDDNEDKTTEEPKIELMGSDGESDSENDDDTDHLSRKYTSSPILGSDRGKSAMSLDELWDAPLNGIDIESIHRYIIDTDEEESIDDADSGYGQTEEFSGNDSIVNINDRFDQEEFENFISIVKKTKIILVYLCESYIRMIDNTLNYLDPTACSEIPSETNTLKYFESVLDKLEKYIYPESDSRTFNSFVREHLDKILHDSKDTKGTGNINNIKSNEIKNDEDYIDLCYEELFRFYKKYSLDASSLFSEITEKFESEDEKKLTEDDFYQINKFFTKFSSLSTASNDTDSTEKCRRTTRSMSTATKEMLTKGSPSIDAKTTTTTTYTGDCARVREYKKQEQSKLPLMSSPATPKSSRKRKQVDSKVDVITPMNCKILRSKILYY